MKCHKYQLIVSSDAMSAIHGEGAPQNRLYIPNKGIIGYRFYGKNKIDCFLRSKYSIETAEKIIRGKIKKVKYLGEINIPKEKINEFIQSYRAKEKAEETFQKKGADLVSLI